MTGWRPIADWKAKGGTLCFVMVNGCVIPDTFVWNAKRRMFDCGELSLKAVEVEQVKPFASICPPGYKSRNAWAVDAQVLH